MQYLSEIVTAIITAITVFVGHMVASRRDKREIAARQLEGTQAYAKNLFDQLQTEISRLTERVEDTEVRLQEERKQREEGDRRRTLLRVWIGSLVETLKREGIEVPAPPPDLPNIPEQWR